MIITIYILCFIITTLIIMMMMMIVMCTGVVIINIIWSLRLVQDAVRHEAFPVREEDRYEANDAEVGDCMAVQPRPPIP